jgi:hypothetical protein
VVSFGGSELEKYFQQNYVIGTQSFVLSREYQWNNGQAITASSTNSQVNFTFTVQESSTAGGQIVEATPTAPINTNPPSATNIPNAPNPSSSTDPEQFVRTYFYSLTHDRNYQNSWSLLTDGFKNKNSPGGYNDYVTFWDKIDSVDVNSINFFEQTSTDAKCAVNLTFNAKQGGNQTVNIKYHLIYNSDRQTWLFESP